MELPTGGKSGPFCNRVHHGRIHSKLPLLNHKPQPWQRACTPEEGEVQGEHAGRVPPNSWKRWGCHQWRWKRTCLVCRATWGFRSFNRADRPGRKKRMEATTMAKHTPTSMCTCFPVELKIMKCQSQAIREGEEDEEIMKSWICSWGFSEMTRVRSAMRWVTWAGGILSRFRMVLGSGRN